MRSSKWHRGLPNRAKVTLGEKLATEPKSKRVDIGQSAGRQPLSKEDTLPTLLPGSQIWMLDLEEQRVVCGKEMLLSSLFPAELASKQAKDDNLMGDLAGNCQPGGRLDNRVFSSFRQMHLSS